MTSDFLKFSKQSLKSTSSSVKKLTLVSGNQSADLDSVVSSILYSYFHHLNNKRSAQDKSKQQDTSIDEIVIPLINIPSEDLCLRKDVEFVLKSVDIDFENLLFLNDLVKDTTNTNDKSLINKFPLIDLVLVDHNVPQGASLQNFIKQNNIKIKSIIDHHVDEKSFTDAKPRIIKTVGSNTSLVLNYWNSVLNFKTCQGLSFYNDLQNCLFALSPILIDTACLKARVEKDDTEAFELIKSLNSKINTTEINKWYGLINDAKSNYEGLSVRDILRKDYKVFQYKSSSDSKTYKIGISSMSKPIEYLLTEFKDSQVLEILKQWQSENSLDFVTIMASYTDSNDKFKRDLAFFTDKSLSPSSSSDELVDKAIKFLNKDLDLATTELLNDNSFKITNSNEFFKIYNQKNLKASRKLVAPLLKDFIESI
ncbi:hypothetical protein BVG19_g899 [[Candida] boidinii]|nr:hypothetical protein BVG19_g899 [[Candida] boidinii]OWB48704.1 hypothetical protein B5S27_g239 [[Candida] boidinii]